MSQTNLHYKNRPQNSFLMMLTEEYLLGTPSVRLLKVMRTQSFDGVSLTFPRMSKDTNSYLGFLERQHFTVFPAKDMWAGLM